MADEWIDANEWIDDEGAYQEALEGTLVDGDAGEVRYGLTAAGALALDEGGPFSGFGPCATSGASLKAPAAGRPRRVMQRSRRRPTPLFG